MDAAVFEPVPWRSAIADGCTHVLVLCTRPARARKSAVSTALEDAMEAAIKRAVLSPDYMVPAWKVGEGRWVLRQIMPEWNVRGLVVVLSPDYMVPAWKVCALPIVHTHPAHPPTHPLHHHRPTTSPPTASPRTTLCLRSLPTHINTHA